MLNPTNKPLPRDWHRDPKTAFNEAIAEGFLSADPTHPTRYAGDFMYMHSNDQGDDFKNIATRYHITNRKTLDREKLDDKWGTAPRRLRVTDIPQRRGPRPAPRRVSFADYERELLEDNDDQGGR